ncbi:zinc-binding dehydrogenase [Colletotrichum truncatum]|uniref:Zinc-binding dehydrogenase n=1 Tax=Colletotrichum truncatum TaxID=5467 RepID=A0ACC3YUF0_COLTU|nr:zinc-binding dehydrogenase [Colletotrichum truncatum]KAF6789859.1 zinc-binding dehydrogenase [Colletotrichum truncatum]
MTPSSTKQWLVTCNNKGFDGLESQEVAIPQIGETEVLVKLNAAALNYRDLVIAKGTYPHPNKLPVVPLSDGAGDVIEVGSKVRQFKKGDKVATVFLQRSLYGPMNRDAWPGGIGGVLDGTLRQYAIFPETGLVRSPRNLTDIETATLPCAALTAWNCLYGLKQVKPGEVVLTQGTDGVSMFALQFAKAAGATVIATTSSAEKAEKLKKLGADHVINYKENPNWGKIARSLTLNGEGVDHIIEVGGAQTIEQSLEAIKFEGVVTIIGFLAGQDVKASVFECFQKVCTTRGAVVGSRAMMEEMVAAIEANDIHPVVDETIFTFEQAKEAYQYLWDAKHFGKVAIKIE